jgi:hypothetical protein
VAKFIVGINDFSGGKNSTVHSASIGLDEFDGKNIEIDDFGSVRVVKTYTVLNTDGVGGGNGAFVFTKNNGTQSFLVAGASSIHSLSGTTFVTISSSEGLFTANINVEFAQFRDIVVISNGGLQPYKYNGTEFTRAGVSAPVQVLTASTNSNGTLTGTYRYKYAGVNSYSVEGDVIASQSSDFTPASEEIIINNIPTAPVSHGIESWNLYRNTAGVSDTYYRVTNITNGTTSYVDNNSDSTLVTDAPSDNGTPPYFIGMKVLRARLFGFEKDSSDLWYSNIDDPETFQSTSFLRIEDGDGMFISGISETDGHLLIQKNDGKGRGALYELNMPTTVSTDWQVFKLANEGGEGHRSLVSTPLGVFVLNRFNAYLLSRSEQGGGRFLNVISYNIQNDLRSDSSSGTANNPAIFFRNKLFIGVGSGMYRYDFGRALNPNSKKKSGSWVTSGFPSVKSFVVYAGKLYCDAGGDVYLLDEDQATTDFGAVVRFRTAYLKGDKRHTDFYKAWRRAFIYIDANSLGNISANVENEYGATQSITINDSPDITGSLRKRVVIGLNGAELASRMLRFRFETESTAKHFKIHEVRLEYGVLGKRNE